MSDINSGLLRTSISSKCWMTTRICVKSTNTLVVMRGFMKDSPMKNEKNTISPAPRRLSRERYEQYRLAHRPSPSPTYNFRALLLFFFLMATVVTLLILMATVMLIWSVVYSPTYLVIAIVTLIMLSVGSLIAASVSR